MFQVHGFNFEKQKQNKNIYSFPSVSVMGQGKVNDEISIILRFWPLCMCIVILHIKQWSWCYDAILEFWQRNHILQMPAPLPVIYSIDLVKSSFAATFGYIWMFIILHWFVVLIWSDNYILSVWIYGELKFARSHKMEWAMTEKRKHEPKELLIE